VPAPQSSPGAPRGVSCGFLRRTRLLRTTVFRTQSVPSCLQCRWVDSARHWAVPAPLTGKLQRTTIRNVSGWQLNTFCHFKVRQVLQTDRFLREHAEIHTAPPRAHYVLVYSNLYLRNRLLRIYMLSRYLCGPCNFIAIECLSFRIKSPYIYMRFYISQISVIRNYIFLHLCHSKYKKTPYIHK
jgi:hypothetical protein